MTADLMLLLVAIAAWTLLLVAVDMVGRVLARRSDRFESWLAYDPWLDSDEVTE